MSDPQTRNNYAYVNNNPLRVCGSGWTLAEVISSGHSLGACVARCATPLPVGFLAVENTFDLDGFALIAKEDPMALGAQPQ
jgi:hypothetical protein